MSKMIGSDDEGDDRLFSGDLGRSMWLTMRRLWDLAEISNLLDYGCKTWWQAPKN